VARAQRTHEIPTPAPRPTAPGGWRSPVQAVQVFTQAYINWTAATVARHLRILAYVSVGQAHSAMSLAAAQTAKDSDLQRGGIANSGIVEAIAPVTGERNVYAVVTRERTTATNTSAYRGLAATWHVTLATVTQIERGLWTLSGWQPES
jgi:NADH:ubiquinone oxidoreductase subunit 2 (subunit N)